MAGKVPNKKAFDAAYRVLADQGKADEPGGGEYMRVYGEWVMANCPAPVSDFIYWRANEGGMPDAPGLPDPRWFGGAK